jgi:hypothetical protein
MHSPYYDAGNLLSDPKPCGTKTMSRKPFTKEQLCLWVGDTHTSEQEEYAKELGLG